MPIGAVASVFARLHCCRLPLAELMRMPPTRAPLTVSNTVPRLARNARWRLRWYWNQLAKFCISGVPAWITVRTRHAPSGAIAATPPCSSVACLAELQSDTKRPYRDGIAVLQLPPPTHAGRAMDAVVRR